MPTKPAKTSRSLFELVLPSFNSERRMLSRECGIKGVIALATSRVKTWEQDAPKRKRGGGLAVGDDGVFESVMVTHEWVVERLEGGLEFKRNG